MKVTKEVIRAENRRTDRNRMDKKKINNDILNTIQKTNDYLTRTPLITESEFRWSSVVFVTYVMKILPLDAINIAMIFKTGTKI